MAKIGDTVRFLNSVGGGKITRIDGRIAYVDEDGFETPVLLNEVVVVLPAGHEPAPGSGKKMFDQQAFDNGKKAVRDTPKQKPEPAPELPVEETEYGEELSILLAFEPENVKELSKTGFNVALINDSNYYLYYTVLIRDFEAMGWKPLATGEIAPNEIFDIARYTQDNISEMERIVFQAMAYKKGKPFQVKYPVSVSKKLDLTKFFKAHCFRPGVYIDSPVIEFPLYSERKK